jgi:hypothetical protein
MKEFQEVLPTPTGAEIAEQIAKADEVFDQIWQHEKVDPFWVAYSLWVNAMRTLVMAGWTERELNRDLLYHVRDAINEEETMKKTAKKIGDQLYSYMQFRAEPENQTHEFTADFYEAAVLDGCGDFFGVTFADDLLVGDPQNPTTFRQWQQRH